MCSQVVTGSTGGLGKTIALFCVQSGARGVMITGRCAERGARVAFELSALRPDCLVVFQPCDVSKAGDCEALCEAAIAAFGTVDGLVNCAALCFPRGTLADTSLELWNVMMSTNLTAPFLLTQRLSAHMKSTGVRGSIVNIGSVAAHGGAPFIMAYSVTKGALGVLTKNNAEELRPARVRVNQINMGWCLTDAENTGQTAENGADWLAKADASSGIGRLLRPEDTASSVIHLLSDASSMITGAIIDISPDVIPGMMPC